MNVLNFIQRNGMVLSLPTFIVSAFLLFLCIQNLIKLGDRSRLFSLPLVERQTVRFEKGGTVALSLEGPRLSARFSELSFDLISSDGTHIRSSASLLHARSSGISIIRVELVSFPVPHPGEYVLAVLNLNAPREGDGEHKIVLSTPHHMTMVGLILGIILSAGTLIGSIVLFILSMVKNKG